MMVSSRHLLGKGVRIGNNEGTLPAAIGGGIGCGPVGRVRGYRFDLVDATVEAGYSRRWILSDCGGCVFDPWTQMVWQPDLEVS